MVIVAVMGALVLFTAVKAGISPLPPAASPMAVLSLAQLKVAPLTGLPGEVSGTEAPLHQV